MRHAGLLLRLPNPARNFCVDRLVVRRLAAQQAAQRDHRVHLAAFGRRPRRVRHLPRARHTHHRHIFARRAAASQAIERTLQQPVRNHSVPARGHNHKAHPLGRHPTLDRRLHAMHRVFRLPEADLEAAVQAQRKQPRLPVRRLDRAQPLRGSPASPRPPRASVRPPRARGPAGSPRSAAAARPACGPSPAPGLPQAPGTPTLRPPGPSSPCPPQIRARPAARPAACIRRHSRSALSPSFP